MLPFLTHPHSHPFWVLRIVFCSVLFLISVPFSSEADDPLKHDPIGDGIKAGDQDQQIKDIDRQLENKTLTPDQRTKLESDRARYEERINDKRSKYLDEDLRTFDRAREARGKQHELEEAKKNLGQAFDKKRAQRTIDRMTSELDIYPEDIRKALKDTPLAAAPAPTGESYAFTGLVLQMDWRPPPSTTPTNNLGNLPTLISGFSMNSGFTPVNFSQSLQDAGQNATGNWLAGDNQSPPVQNLNEGKVNFNVNLRYAFGERDSDYQLAIGAGFNATSVSFFQEDLLPRNDIGTRTMNNNPSLIVYFRLGTDPWRLGPPLMGRSLEWSVENYLSGRIYSNFQESDADRSTFFDRAGQSITGWELNAGVTGAPAPGLTPSTWSDTEAWPIPHIEMEASR